MQANAGQTSGAYRDGAPVHYARHRSEQTTLYRLVLAAQPLLVTPVLQVVHRVITRHLLDQTGFKAFEADSGAVTLIQRFGSAANLNIHLHCLVLDGAYRRSDSGPVFVEGPAPTDEDLQALLHRIITRLMKLLTRRGVLVEEEQGDRATWLTARPIRMRPARSGRCRRRRGLAGRAWPVARLFARHKQSTGLVVSGLSLPHCLRPTRRAARCSRCKA